MAIPKNELQQQKNKDEKSKLDRSREDSEEIDPRFSQIYSEERKQHLRPQGQFLAPPGYPPSRYPEEEYPPHESPFLNPEDSYDYRRPPTVYRPPPSPAPIPRVEGYLECPTCGTHVPVPRSRYVRAPGNYYEDPRRGVREPPIDPRYMYEELGYMPPSPYYQHPPAHHQSPYLSYYDRGSHSMYDGDFRGYAPTIEEMKSPGYSLRENRKKRKDKEKKKKSGKSKYLKNTKTIDDIDATFAKKISKSKSQVKEQLEE